MKSKAKIFLSYARTDQDKVKILYQKLSKEGFNPWMDIDILPGENWRNAIKKAIKRSDFFLACLSANSVNRRGYIQKEIRDALEIWKEKLDNDIYLIPVRLEDCEVPESLSDFQWVNLFEDGSWEKLKKATQVGMERRKNKQIPVPEPKRSPFTPEHALRVRSNLEREPSYFFGREEILKSLLEELKEANQTVILKGFGGVGKSTLAIKLAYECMRRDLFEMIVWIDVRKYQENQSVGLNEVIETIVHTYDPESGLMKEIDLQNKIHAVIQLVSQCSTLIVLDNFESIIQDSEASHETEESAICKFINRLPLKASAEDDTSSANNLVRVVITTREISKAMDILQPRIHVIDKLNFKAAKELMDSKAKDLSFSRDLKKSLRNKYVTIYKLTYGIPKLIEVVIGQVPYLPFEEIQRSFGEPLIPLERSDDIYGYLFEESWSEILNEAQKQILMSMIFFIEHAPLEAIRMTTDVNDEELKISIKGLYDMSLLEIQRHDYARIVYKLHPLTQKMSEAQIKKVPDFASSAGKRFINFYLKFSKQYYKSNPETMGREIKNIIAAMKLSEKLSEWQLLVDFRDSVNHFMWISGYWRERVEANKSILRACRESNNDPLAAEVFVKDLGFTFLRFENLDKAEEYVKDGLQIYQKLKDKRGIALAIRHLGKSALLKGEYEWLESGLNWHHYFEESERLYSESLNLREELSLIDIEEQVAIADLKMDFGRLYWLWGRKSEGDGRTEYNRKLIQKALYLYNKSIDASWQGQKLFEKNKNLLPKKAYLRGIAKALGNLANAEKEIGLYHKREKRIDSAHNSFSKAEELYKESLHLAKEINKVDEIAHAEWGLAEINELYSEMHKSKKKKTKHLLSALDLAEDSNRLYRRMATPGDIKVTRALVSRLKEKVHAMH